MGRGPTLGSGKRRELRAERGEGGGKASKGAGAFATRDARQRQMGGDSRCRVAKDTAAQAKDTRVSLTLVSPSETRSAAHAATSCPSKGGRVSTASAPTPDAGAPGPIARDARHGRAAVLHVD